MKHKSLEGMTLGGFTCQEMVYVKFGKRKRICYKGICRCGRKLTVLASELRRRNGCVKCSMKIKEREYKPNYNIEKFDGYLELTWTQKSGQYKIKCDLDLPEMIKGRRLNCNGKRRIVYKNNLDNNQASLARFILGIEDMKHLYPHFKNGDHFDFREENLVAIPYNTFRQRSNFSYKKKKYFGVKTLDDYYIAQCCGVIGKCHRNEKDAAREYDKLARLYLGPYAKTNFGGRGE